MAPFLKKYGQNWIQRFCGSVLRQGPMPNHIGFIMDGNRRFAKSRNLGSPTEGHMAGDKKLSEVCQMLVDLAIPEATVYYFSLENFNRSAEEVDGLMNIFAERMHAHLGELSTLKKMGYGIEIIGDYTKATTPSLRNLFAKVMWSTRNNKTFRLNIAIAYGGQAEISKSVGILKDGLKSGMINVDDLTEELVEDTFKLSSSRKPDIIIRTGGDRRLSDFMLWQGCNAHIHFLKGVFWPEFSNWQLLWVILQFQFEIFYNNQSDGCVSVKDGGIIGSGDQEERQQNFLGKWKEEAWRNIMKDANKI